YGVFLSFDLFLLFVFYELAIIPKYFLIAIWGSTRKEYGAMKLTLYSFVGSAMVLVGLIAAYTVAGAKTTSLLELAKFPFPESFQYWAFPLVFVGFAILAGLWPFHTWAPTGHVAAPTAASMLLAGVVMKLGAYGSLRVAMTLFPHGLDDWSFKVLGFGSWRDVLAVIAGVGILIGVAYTLRAMQLAFFGESAAETTVSKASSDHSHSDITPISIPERIGAVLLIGTALLIGLYPRLLLDLIVPSFDSPLFDGLRKVGLA